MTDTDTYLAVCTIRRFEERLVALKADGQIQGGMHLACGQEAIAVGACRTLDGRDALTTTYRGHHWALARGVPPSHLFAELLGRESPLCGGRGGSAHFSSADHGLLGENSIVAAGVPIGAGAALAAQLSGDGSVSVVAIGDGAMNQGAAHEALNLAGVMRLPLVTIVENNGWAELTPARAMVPTETLAERGAIYGMPGERVDGNDAAAVEAVVATAVERARAGGGPSLIEAMTARITGHYDLDPQHYRPADDLQRAREHEPLARLRAQLGERRAERIERDVAAVLDAAVAEATAMPFPDPATASEHVHA